MGAGESAACDAAFLRQGEPVSSIIAGYIIFGFAWLCLGAACVGAFVPVPPTTPLLLLATFLFGKFSPRCHAAIASSKVHRSCMAPFKEAGGMPVKAKMRMLFISLSVLATSAALVRKPFVWGILVVVVLFLAYLMVARIPTVGGGERRRARDERSGGRGPGSRSGRSGPKNQQPLPSGHDIDHAASVSAFIAK